MSRSVLPVPRIPVRGSPRALAVLSLAAALLGAVLEPAAARAASTCRRPRRCVSPSSRARVACR
jgi:hypothetical protein